MQNFFATILATIIAATGALANNAQHLSETISGHLFPRVATSVDYATEPQAAAATSLPNPFGAASFATHDDSASSSSALTLSTTSQKVQSTAPDASSAVSNLRGTVLGASAATPSIIERVVQGGITQEQLDAALNGLSAQFNQRLSSLPAPVISFSGPAATTPVSTATFAPSQRIDQLANVVITNATVHGVNGLTDADLPDSLTANNYLPLAGGALSGDLTMSGTLTAGALSVAGISSAGALIGPYVTATSTTATSTFAGGLAVGISALTVLQNGNVGIGTTSPGSKFHVDGSNSVVTIGTNSSNQSQIILQDDNAANGYGRFSYAPATAGTFTAFLNNQLQLYAGSGATNGIALLTEAAPIVLGSQANFHVGFNLNNLTSVGGNGPNFSFANNVNVISSNIVGGSINGATGAAAYGTLTLQGGAGAGANSAGFALTMAGGRSTGSASGGDIVFQTAPAGGSGSSLNALVERLRISNTGNVGIASTTPWAKLSVTNTGAGPSFVVEDDTSPDSTPFIIDASGNVGIGTTTPNVKLSVYNGTSNAAGTGLLTLTADYGALGTAGYGGYLGFKDTGGAHAEVSRIASLVTSGNRAGLAFSAYSGSGLAEVLRLTGNSQVGIASTTPWRTLSVTGTVGFDGLTGSTGAGSLCLDSNKQVVYNSASDNCLSSTRATKHDINPLVVDALAQVLALQPVSFAYNEGDGRTRYGFIAEDTAAVDAHLATYDASSSVSGIDDRSIIAILVGAVKDLYAKMQEYFARTERLEERVSALEAQLAGSAAAGAPNMGDGAPDGPSAPEAPSTDSATTTTPASASSYTSTAANDTQPIADEEPEAQEPTSQPASEGVAEPVPVQENSLPEPANDNPPPTDLPE